MKIVIRPRSKVFRLKVCMSSSVRSQIYNVVESRIAKVDTGRYFTCVIGDGLTNKTGMKHCSIARARVSVGSSTVGFIIC